MYDIYYVKDGNRKRNNLRPTFTLTVLPGRRSPFFGPEVRCPEINDQTLGKISKTFFSCVKPRFKNILKNILTAVL